MEVDRDRFDEIARCGLAFALQLVLILGGLGFASAFAVAWTTRRLFYLVAELLMLVSVFGWREPRRGALHHSAAAVGIGTTALSGVCFVLAAFHFPGGGYNPFFRMLSALGRTEVCSVRYPPSHFLFVAGTLVGAWGVLAISRRLNLSQWGAALNVGGLLIIALVPEDVSMPFHNAGCWLATVGGGLMLARWLRFEPTTRTRLFWAAILLFPLLAICSGLILHGLHMVPFAPWVPTAQKGVILSFAAWVVWLSVRPQPAICRRACVLVLVAGIVVGACAANSMEVRFG